MLLQTTSIWQHDSQPKASGRPGAVQANFSGSTGTDDTVTFTSDFLDFSQVIAKDFAANLNALTPRLLLGANGTIGSFDATLGGSFSSDPAPLLVGTIPEPASWALMITGFIMLGAALRQSKAKGTLSYQFMPAILRNETRFTA